MNILLLCYVLKNIMKSMFFIMKMNVRTLQEKIFYNASQKTVDNLYIYIYI